VERSPERVKLGSTDEFTVRLFKVAQGPESQSLSRPRRGWFYAVHKSSGSTYDRRL
ncbi:MAG: hypothetical protein ACI8ZW_000062, partial [Yoonia sp.]